MIGYFIYPNYFLAIAIAVLAAMQAIGYVRPGFIVISSIMGGFPPLPSQESTVLLRFLLREYDANAELVIAFLECTMLSIDFDIKS